MRPRPPSFPIAAVLEALGFEDVPRIRGTGHRTILCRFHQDSRPSASVSQYGFRCWSCGRTGDAIRLIREEEGLSYQEAVARCEELTGGGNDGGEPSANAWGSGSLLD